MPETPNAITPSPRLNRLLDSDERFALDGGRCLLAPKTVAKLEAARFICHEEGTERFTVSHRALRAIDVSRLDEGFAMAEAGASVYDFEQTLREHGVATGWTADPAITSKTTVGEAVAGQWLLGKQVEATPFDRRLLKVDMVASDGALATVGATSVLAPGLRAAALLHRTPYQEGIVVGVTVKVDRCPPSNACWTWKSRDRNALWDLWKQCYRSHDRWELLDMVIPGRGEEHSFLVASVSGTERVLAQLEQRLPVGATEDRGAVSRLQQYLSQQAAVADRCGAGTPFAVEGARYLWWHGLDRKGTVFHKGP